MDAPRIELLAPARDLACGRAAVDCGADAVYIGAPRFGARARAGNTLDDVAALVAHAHRYWARVYVTLNTLLRDDEIDAAVELAHQVHALGADGLIIQDVGLLECDLPPLPLIASTQMHNHTPERVLFLERLGFQRAILARELTLEEIRAIRAATSLELEAFVHGALCVSYSGQCCLSWALGGRSGNRGECAQPCRLPYDLVDGQGRVLLAGRHLLSLRDLNLSAHLGDLLDAGVTSFKIEGRLKDEVYVRNVVTAYRRRLDLELEARGLRRASSGRSHAGFQPDLSRTFNRGFTTYFFGGRRQPPGAIDTPKMVGQSLGRVTRVDERSFTLDCISDLHPGDGLCFFGATGELRGTQVNSFSGRRVVPAAMDDITPGVLLHRNRDQAFLRGVRQARVERRIDVRLGLREDDGGLVLGAADEDGISASARRDGERETPRDPGAAAATAARQLASTGGTVYASSGVDLAWSQPWFLPISALNQLRRAVLEALGAERARRRPVTARRAAQLDACCPEAEVTYLGNALNERAVAFYRRHGAHAVEPAAESGLDLRGRRLMRTRYCLREQLGWCLRRPGAPHADDELALLDPQGRRLALRFDCSTCHMDVYWGQPRGD